MNLLKRIEEQIGSRKAKVAVMGIGYVGLPLATGIAKSGFQVFGLDPNEERVSSLMRGESYSPDVHSEDLKNLIDQKKFIPTSDNSVLWEADIICICVPTLFDHQKNPDISCIEKAIEQVSEHLKTGHLIVLESTTYPGTTEEVVLPKLLSTGMKLEEDFFLAFSPERIDPGNHQFSLENTPKVVGGVTQGSTFLTKKFYENFVKEVIPVGSARTAEMVKLVENSFRIVNIGFVNELAMMCDRLQVDTWEVLDAAATKPFGFMKFSPGPGVGGRCIPITPHFLRWKIETLGMTSEFIKVADEVNSRIPKYLASEVVNLFHDSEVKNRKVLLLGVAYKKDVSDYQYSPALDLILLLQNEGFEVSYHDPFVPYLKTETINLSSVPLDDAINEYDVVVLLTLHSSFSLPEIIKKSKMLIDTRNVASTLYGSSHKVIEMYDGKKHKVHTEKVRAHV